MTRLLLRLLQLLIDTVRFDNDTNSNNNEESRNGALVNSNKFHRSTRGSRAGVGRSYIIDKDDVEYLSFGGVERVRRRLLWAALVWIVENNGSSSRSSSSIDHHHLVANEEYDSKNHHEHDHYYKQQQHRQRQLARDVPPDVCLDLVSYNLITSIINVLQLTYSPQTRLGSQSLYVESMIKPISTMERNLILFRSISTKVTWGVSNSRSRSGGGGGGRISAAATGTTPASATFESFVTALTSPNTAKSLNDGGGGNFTEAFKNKLVKSTIDSFLPSSSSSSSKQRGGSTDLDQVITIALLTCEIRMLDCLLRILRDRLLNLSFRLSRTEKHWRRKLHQSRIQKQPSSSLASLGWLLKKKLRMDSTESDRLRLAFAKSAYTSEVSRLGKVIQIITQRPDGLQDSKLAQAVRYTVMLENSNNNDNKDNGHIGISPDDAYYDDNEQHLQSHSSNPKSSFAMPSVGKFSLRYNTDGRGKFRIYSYEESMTVGGEGALKVLLEADKDNPEMATEWIQEAKEWICDARRVLYEVVNDSIIESMQPTQNEEQKLQRIKSWTIGEYDLQINAGLDDIGNQWQTIYELIRDIHTYSRLGEGQKLRLKETNLYIWFRQYDLLGLPSALLNIFLAKVANQWFVEKLNWSLIYRTWRESYDLSIEIFKQRFYEPIKELVDDIMNREKNSLLTGFDVLVEETSLDNMLRDLQFGDGTPGTRRQALEEATRQYENDMNTGLFRHAMGGRLVRLILIQGELRWSQQTMQ